MPMPASGQLAELLSNLQVTDIIANTTPEEREALVLGLLLEDHGRLTTLEADVSTIKNERRYLYGAGHLLAVVVATTLSYIGLPAWFGEPK